MAVLSFAEELTGGTLGLSSGLDELLILEFGGSRVLYGLSIAESRLIELSVSTLGQLTYSSSLELAGAFLPGLEPHLAESSLSSGERFLTISGVSSQAGQRVSLSMAGTLGAQTTLSGVGHLDQAVSLAPGNVPVLLSAAESGGLDFFSDTGSGFAIGTGLDDTASSYLADITASVVFLDDGVSYVATVSAIENGLNLASVSTTGLLQTGAIGAEDSLPIGLPADLATFAQLGQSWLVVASQNTSSLSTVRVENGVPLLADHIYDSQETRFQGASQVAAQSYGDFAFIAAGGDEGGFSLFSMLPTGRLIHLDSVAEDETVPLAQVQDLELFVAGGALQVVAASGVEPGLVRFSYDLSDVGQVVRAANDGQGGAGTSLDDQMIGSVANDILAGMAGDDILLDGHGTDTLSGGSGADLFVMTADGQTDEIVDFEPGIDRLDLSAFDFLYDVAQLTVSSTTTGAILSFGAEVLNVVTADLTPLTQSDLTSVEILNVDRPPFLLVGREIIGTAADELLNGGPGDDTIFGIGGNDSLVGGPGLDILSGSQGSDTLHGDGASDTLYGGVGDDLLFGGDGNDIIYGDDWP